LFVVLPVRQIGSGSFGSVYLVTRKSDSHQCVLKQIHMKQHVPEKEIENFKHEVNMLMELVKYKNISKINKIFLHI
jgi:serine/threonine protein kinase